MTPILFAADRYAYGMFLGAFFQPTCMALFSYMGADRSAGLIPGSLASSAAITLASFFLLTASPGVKLLWFKERINPFIGDEGVRIGLIGRVAGALLGTPFGLIISTWIIR